MTLKEKFKPFVFYVTESFNVAREKDKEKNAIECELIADEFAIEFAEWVRKETYYEHLTKEFIYKSGIYESEKELLEIFKKEKGL